MIQFNLRKITSSILILTILVSFWGFFPQVASADPLEDMSDTMSSLKKEALSNHSILFTTPTGVASTETIVVTFPDDFDGENDPDGALSVSDVNLLVNNTPNGACDGTLQNLVASSPSSSQWSAVFSGTENRVLTFTSGGASAVVAAGAEVCIKIGEHVQGGGVGNSQYINPTTSGNYIIALSVGSGADTGDITVVIIDDDTVVVSATVAHSINFVISDNSIGFGTLSPFSARFATGNELGDNSEVQAHTITVGTNASSGYSMTVDGTTLTSGANTIDAIGSSNTASNPGTEQFGLRATATGGSGTVSAPYAASGFALNTAAFPSQVASAGGVTANTVYSLRYIANISLSTETGAYTANLTYVVTTLF